MATPTSLFLAPADVQASTQRDPVISVLRDLEIIGDEIERDTFSAADGFSRHVVYAGCSPHLVMFVIGIVHSSSSFQSLILES